MGDRLRIEPTTRASAASCASSCRATQPCVMRPSRSTAVASTISSPAPEMASWPRCTWCQSPTTPSTEEYWHMGAMTMRLGSASGAQLPGVEKSGHEGPEGCRFQCRASTGASECPVCEPAATTASGGPCTTTRPAAVAAFGDEVDHPVGLGDDVQVVLDHHTRCGRRPPAGASTRISFSTSAMCRPTVGSSSTLQRVRRLVAAAGDVVAHLAQLGDQLDALRLAAAERWARAGPASGSPAPRP